MLNKNNQRSYPQGISKWQVKLAKGPQVSHSYKMNKKGQVGETVTWFIATIVIILILMFFTFGASYLAKAKGLLEYSESAFSKAIYEGDDIYLKKTIYSQLTANEQKLFDIGQYIKKRNEDGGFEIQVNTTSKKIKENFNKK